MIRNIAFLAIGAFALPAFAQAPQSNDQPQATPQPQASSQGGTSEFGQAFSNLLTGAKGAEKVGDMLLHKQPDGSVVAEKQNPPQPAPGQKTDDASLLDAIKSKLSSQPDTANKNVGVGVKNGVATLTGKVSSLAEAEKVIKTVLETPGVSKVVSKLGVGSLGIPNLPNIPSL